MSRGSYKFECFRAEGARKNTILSVLQGQTSLFCAPQAREKNTNLSVLERQKWVFCAPQAREKMRFGAFYKGKMDVCPPQARENFGVPSRKMDDPPLFHGSGPRRGVIEFDIP